MAKLNLTKTRFRKPLTMGQKALGGLLVLALAGVCFRDIDLLGVVRAFDPKALLELAGRDDGLYVFMFVMIMGLTAMASYRTKIDGAIKKLKSNPSYSKVLDKLTRQEIKLPVLRPNAWRGLSESLDCMLVKVPNRRLAVWKLESTDEKELTLSANLLYTPEPSGRNRAQIYPRRLHLQARVEGLGVSSKVYLSYSVGSPMDLIAVKELIQKTNEAIVSHIMAAETEPARLSEFAESANQLATVAESSEPEHVVGYTFSDQVMNF